jgi:hypothetical protein
MKKALAYLIDAAIAAVFVCAFACSKQDAGQSDITGAWRRTQPTAVEYLFFDDSRFRQSDRPGEQWIWEQGVGTVRFYGNPERAWNVVFLSDTRARIVEVDTFEIERK